MSDTPADTVTEAPQTQPEAPETAPDTGTDLEAELNKWKAQARKHEDRAKANAAAQKELEKLREQSMTEQERAVEEARKAARSEVLIEVGSARVDDAVRVAAAGRPVDVDALLEGLNRARFLDEDGNPDRDAIAAWVDRIAPTPEPGAAATAVLDLGQGARRPAALALNGDPLLNDLKSKLGI